MGEFRKSFIGVDIKDVYEINKTSYYRTLGRLTEILDLDDILHVPVRQLSLGQKMKATMACALIHSPKILFLYEPTIGLDLLAKERMRELITVLNEQSKVTIFLTTHDIADIEKICDRVIMIHQGLIIFDGDISELKKRYTSNIIATLKSDKNVVLPKTFQHFVLADNGVVKKNYCRVVQGKHSIIDQMFKLNINVKNVIIKNVQLHDIVKNIFEDVAMVD